MSVYVVIASEKSILSYIQVELKVFSVIVSTNTHSCGCNNCGC